MKDVLLALLLVAVGGLLIVGLPVAGGIFGMLIGGAAAFGTIWYVIAAFNEESDDEEEEA